MNLGKLLNVLECCFHQCNGLVDSYRRTVGRFLGKAVDKRLQKEQDKTGLLWTAVQSVPGQNHLAGVACGLA